MKASKKQILLLVGAVVLALAAALLCALAVLRASKRAVNDIPSLYSSTAASQPAPAPVSEPDNGIRLKITSETDFDTTEPFAVITGTSDIAQPLTMNGNAVERSSDGSFAVEVQLSVGDNSFTFEHKGESVTCKINYHYVIINAYYPYQKQSYSSGSAFSVTVSARPESEVYAEFNGQKTRLERAKDEPDAEFVNYTGSFTLPEDNETDINMGGVKFTAKYKGVTEVYTSPRIICLANERLAGMTYVAQVVAHAAETFDGNTVDDYSSPERSYLPQGTVDYCSSGMVYDAKSDNSYYKLRCGLRVYVSKKNPPDTGKVTVTTRTRAELPDHNELSVASFEKSGKHTRLVLNTMWRAPFQVRLAPQGYTSPAKQDYTISAATYDYLEIKFFYATSFSGELAIPADDAVFRAAQVENIEGNTILRLYLKKRGSFYGWECEYNDAGQLCFSFLNPTVTSAASNAYGIDLTGVTVAIDAGHGGRDSGALGLNPSVYPEAERNLSLAYKIKAELESIGAKVVMLREGNTSLSADERCRALRSLKPDYCISVHHNSSERSSPHGFGAYHFSPFSAQASRYVYNRTVSAGLYSDSVFEWHYFYLARMTTCPVVLTENGYISSPIDFSGIIDENLNNAKAKAIVRGVADYFANIGR